LIAFGDFFQPVEHCAFRAAHPCGAFYQVRPILTRIPSFL
jgi:hypothetical protein